MNYTSIPLFSLMKHKLAYLDQRQATLAQNVANIDTPAYQPRDVKKPDFEALLNPALQSIGLRVTAPLHQLPLGAAQSPYKQITRESAYETNFNKNRISLEEEMQQISDTAMQHQIVTNLYRKTVDMFKMAIGRPGGA